MFFLKNVHLSFSKEHDFLKRRSNNKKGRNKNEIEQKGFTKKDEQMKESVLHNKKRKIKEIQKSFRQKKKEETQTEEA